HRHNAAVQTDGRKNQSVENLGKGSCQISHLTVILRAQAPEDGWLRCFQRSFSRLGSSFLAVRCKARTVHLFAALTGAVLKSSQRNRMAASAKAWLSAGGCRRGNAAGSVTPGHRGAPYQRARVLQEWLAWPGGGCLGLPAFRSLGSFWKPKRSGAAALRKLIRGSATDEPSLVVFRGVAL
ncbi:MAG: hypothetical protein JWM16_5045, partial [Verrucomicrobiales bacterium]|nr:hypothetical protein [Verrucomicrobiales bacterium]